jgi:hypothetical protein
MKTNTVTQFQGENGFITSDCIAIAFFRPTSGSNPVWVNGIPLEAGQTLSISQTTGDIDKTQYEVKFGTGAGADELYILRTLIMG